MYMYLLEYSEYQVVVSLMHALLIKTGDGVTQRVQLSTPWPIFQKLKVNLIPLVSTSHPATAENTTRNALPRNLYIWLGRWLSDEQAVSTTVEKFTATGS
jgi:hypothetical protein